MIGLIAVSREADALLKSFDSETPTKHLRAYFHQGNLAGRAVVLAEVGPGKVQTAAATQHLIDRYNVDLVISFGSAGALAPNLQVGDVVVANEITLHDFGLDAKDGFQHLGFYDHEHPDGLHYHRTLKVNPQLLSTIQKAISTIQKPDASPKIEFGCLVSGDQVIVNETKKQWLHNTFNAPAVDMESGAMAQVAQLNDVPWLAVRAISDKANETIDFGQLNLITFSDDPASALTRLQKTSRNIGKIIQNPGKIRSALVLRQNMQLAATHAAGVTTALISQLD